MTVASAPMPPPGSEQRALIEELLSQWLSNHSEHCGWPDGSEEDEKECHWPIPDVLRRYVHFVKGPEERFAGDPERWPDTWALNDQTEPRTEP